MFLKSLQCKRSISVVRRIKSQLDLFMVWNHINLQAFIPSLSNDWLLNERMNERERLVQSHFPSKSTVHGPNTQPTSIKSQHLFLFRKACFPFDDESAGVPRQVFPEFHRVCGEQRESSAITNPVFHSWTLTSTGEF